MLNLLSVESGYVAQHHGCMITAQQYLQLAFCARLRIAKSAIKGNTCVT